MEFAKKKMRSADIATLNRWYNRREPETMRYPTMEQVEEADHLTLCRWSRFLHSPGGKAVEKSREEFQKVMDQEKPILDRIVERVKELGGFTPAISKALGWGAFPKTEGGSL